MQRDGAMRLQFCLLRFRPATAAADADDVNARAAPQPPPPPPSASVRRINFCDVGVGVTEEEFFL